MNTNLAAEPEVVSDASLVESSLDGDRDAFGQLVARYQSPICAMAFSACGNVERSEDLAQEIFITAWRKLSTLADAAKFKSWLYGIARNLINNSFRKETRNPVGDADVLNDADVPDFELPDEQAISKEEQAILWHVLSGLPQIYREPMVLFYRQNESVPAVADTLAISEEAVRQRLSRGRTMLSERITRVIRSGLRKSGPGTEFVVVVVGALPIIAAATTAKGAVMGAGAAKGASNASWLATLKSFGLFAGILAIPTAIGGFIGRQLRIDAQGSASEQVAARKLWRLLSLTALTLIFLPFCVTLFATGFLPRESRVSFLNAMSNWLGLSYAAVVLAVAYWLWKRRRITVALAPAPTTHPRKLRRTVAIVTIAVAALLIFCLFDTNYSLRFVGSKEIQNVLQQNKPADLKVWIMQTYPRTIFRTYTDQPPIRSLRVEVRTNGSKPVEYYADLDNVTTALIAAKGLDCPTYIQGRDFEILGAPGRMLPFITAFLFGIGVFYLFRTRRSKTT